jgi:predicted RNase H-like HicB family nuclease
MMRVSVFLELAEEGGYTVYMPSLPGCVSEGDTREEALRNIGEAVKLFLEGGGRGDSRNLHYPL